MITTLLLAAVIGNPIQQAKNLTHQKDYEASEKILNGIKRNDQNVTYLFYKCVNAFSLNKKKEVLKYADEIIYAFGMEVPQRYLDMATIMKADAETWKDDADDLDDIAREMKKAGDRLANNKGGKETQKIQRDVENRLKKMIDDIENKQKSDADAQAKAEEDKRKQDGSQPQPPPDTHRGQEQGTGKVDQKRVKEIAEVWGKLPEKERAKAMRELTRNMPAKDRAVIEGYFRELQKRSGK